MDTLQAILLGIVQGITEFLPVSSSGHLQIAKEVLGVQLEENLTFDVALHAATVLSTIVVLWSEVWRLLKGLFSRRFNEEQAYVLKLVLSMIPIGIVGFLLKDRINDLLNAPYILAVVGAMLLVTAALLAFAYYAKPRQKETISYRDALIIGLAQACAAMPGLSRSGSTIAITCVFICFWCRCDCFSCGYGFKERLIFFLEPEIRAGKSDDQQKEGCTYTYDGMRLEKLGSQAHLSVHGEDTTLG